MSNIHIRNTLLYIKSIIIPTNLYCLAVFCFFNIYICLFGVVLASTAGEMRDTSVFCLDIGSTGGHWVGRIALWVGQWVCGGLCLLHVWIMNHLSGACGVASIVAAVIEAGAQRPEVWATFLAPRTSHRIFNGILEVVVGWVVWFSG